MDIIDDYIFPKEEFPTWSDELRMEARKFWFMWIGSNRVGYDQAIKEIGDLVDLGISYANQEIQDSSLMDAYWAGIIDGEGTINIWRRTKYQHRKHDSYSIRIAIVNKDLDLIKAFRKYANSNRRIRVKKPISFKHCVCYECQIIGIKAYSILRKLGKFLRVKNTQRDLAIEFWNSLNHKSGRSIITKEEDERRKMYYEKMKELNRRGPS